MRINNFIACIFADRFVNDIINGKSSNQIVNRVFNKFPNLVNQVKSKNINAMDVYHFLVNNTFSYEQIRMICNY